MPPHPSSSGTRLERIADFHYPAGVQTAVSFTVDFDAMINRRLKNEPAMELTQGEFGGRVGVWRLLDLFGRQGIPATFFIPGRICELYPRSVAAIAAQGHEVANHMWEHRIPGERDLEWDHLRRTTETLERISGRRPVGTRSDHSLDLLLEDRYIYRSSMVDVADERPYYVRGREAGERGALLALPVHYTLDDAMYFHFSWYGSPANGQRLQDPEHAHDVFLAAFRHYHRTGGYMNIVLHNFVSGRGLRVAMLERLIGAMKELPGVWFATCEQVATYCLEHFPCRSA